MQITRRIYYTLYHKIKKYPPGPIGLPFFGIFFSLINSPRFYSWIGKTYSPIAMYPLGPKKYQVAISDIKLVNELSKKMNFSHRLPGFSIVSSLGKKEPGSFGTVNGKEWVMRRKLFYNSFLKLTDSEFMTKHVQNNIKNKIIIPSIEDAIANDDGLWYPKDACFHFTFSTIFGASF